MMVQGKAMIQEVCPKTFPLAGYSVEQVDDVFDAHKITHETESKHIKGFGLVMSQFTLKSGENRGNRRIWIEGQRLSSHRLPWGTELNRIQLSDDTLVLTTIPADQLNQSYLSHPDLPLKVIRTHTVAGKPSRPVIDLCGKWVTRFMGEYSHFDATITRCQHGVSMTITRTNQR